jgi:hypothetical protein
MILKLSRKNGKSYSPESSRTGVTMRREAAKIRVSSLKVHTARNPSRIVFGYKRIGGPKLPLVWYVVGPSESYYSTDLRLAP